MKTKTHQDLCWHLPLLVAVFIQLWPIVFMVSTSLKDMDQIFQATLNPLPLPPTLNNYLTVLGNFPLFTYIYNTFFIAAFVTVFKVLTSVLAAFAFIYYDFKYKETVFYIFVLADVVPRVDDDLVLVVITVLMDGEQEWSQLVLPFTGIALACRGDDVNIKRIFHRRIRNIEVSALLKIVIGESSSGFTGTDPAA